MRIFEHPDFGQVRVVDQNGGPWFVAKDVAAILGSQKPEAKRFKKWVTSEVLPDIRKRGFYGTDQFVDHHDQ